MNEQLVSYSIEVLLEAMEDLRDKLKTAQAHDVQALTQSLCSVADTIYKCAHDPGNTPQVNAVVIVPR